MGASNARKAARKQKFGDVHLDQDSIQRMAPKSHKTREATDEKRAPNDTVHRQRFIVFVGVQPIDIEVVAK